MAEEIVDAVSSQVGQIQNLSELVASSISFQIALAVLVIGILAIVTVYRKFSSWVKKQKFHYSRPHISRLVRTAVLPFFAIALISSVNAYLQVFELFDEEAEILSAEMSLEMTPGETFAKILNSINILVIGYTIAQLIPLALQKKDNSEQEREDFENWKEMKGFKDDDDDFFHKIFEWVPPKQPPKELTTEEFEQNLKTKEGIRVLENFRTSAGAPIGSYRKLVDKPFEEFKKSERAKYEKYFHDCISGNNATGLELKTGQEIEEIYAIDVWREEKRLQNYEPIIPATRPPGYAEKKRKDLPKSFKRILPLGIFVAIIIGVVSWWGVDLFILATATGGLSIGVGLALQETLQNYFAYILIRKDKIFSEGDRIELESGYNGYVKKITPRVTYIIHPFFESYAIIPTRQLVNAQIINYTKEEQIFPAIVDVGVSYLNNPRQVASILMKVGKRAMSEIKDEKGNHYIVQKRCPYLDENRPSCGCDENIHTDFNQPVVRFNKFNDSSLDFTMWVFVPNYGTQFRVESAMRLMIYEEFKKYDIRIPWPIRTIYQGDDKRESTEIAKLDESRKRVLNEYGMGDVPQGSEDME
ncbi:MAG TPA: mechanosensitive ion channel domain-containing protein [Nitrosopumilaceae archaeon]|nr:mechanosensitive ion channel domain-containing protein [Nitrosopumilaceae archaeon]